MFKKSLFSCFFLLFAATPVIAATYVVDSVHSQVHFSVPHLMMFKVRGNFNSFNGSIEVDRASKTLSGAQAEIEAASVNTNNQKRDEHLRSADFFDAANHPQITFVSKRINGNGKDITMVGDLTIRGVTREVVLTGSYLGETPDPWGNMRTGFEARGQIDRRDFGLTWNKALETGGFVVGDQVEIGIEVAAVEQK